MTLYKQDKKAREEKLIALIENEKKQKGVSHKFFLEIIGYNPTNFSLFINRKSGISMDRIEKLEKYFNIKYTK